LTSPTGRAELAVTLVVVSLLGVVGPSGLNGSIHAVSNPQPQQREDIPTFFTEMRNASPEVTNIVWKHELFIEAGLVDSVDRSIALEVASSFPKPEQYVIQNERNVTTNLSEGGRARAFQKKVSTDDLTIYYNRQSVSEIAEVLVISETGLRKASAFLNYVPHRSHGVFLFDSKEDRDKLVQYEVAYPNIYVWYTYDVNNRAYMKYFLIHELTHMVEIDYLGRHWCTGSQWSWLNEGFAEYVGREYFWKTGLVDLRDYYPPQGQVPQNLTQVVSCDNWEAYRARNYWIVYPQAHSVIEYLMEKYGHDSVINVFHNFKSGSSPEDALKNAIGINMNTLEHEWRVWLSSAFVDSDSDGLNDAREQYYGTNPGLNDTDGDGLTDGLEVQLGTSPTNPDTDGDGISDAAEVNIAVDGLLRDWESLKIAPLVSDPKGDNTGGVPGTDLQSVYAALDDKYLYLAFTLHDPINKKDRVEFCFGIDTNGDGTWEYQPGFDLSGNVWLWNLTQGMNYSDLTKISFQYGSIVAASEIVEFRMPLFGIGSPKSMWIEPYLVIELNGQYVAADKASRFHVDTVNNMLPRITDPLVPDAKTALATTTSAQHTTSLTTTPETETGTAPSTQPATGALGIQILLIGGVVFIVLAGAGLFCSHRRRK